MTNKQDLRIIEELTFNAIKRETSTAQNKPIKKHINFFMDLNIERMI